MPLQLIVISQFHLNRLKKVCQQEDNTLSEDTGLCAIYQPQLRLMCDAYAAYVDGLPDSLTLLDNLMANPDFTEFLLKADPADGEIDILDFIKAPAMVNMYTVSLCHQSYLHSTWQQLCISA